jgi:hypothetical protein
LNGLKKTEPEEDRIFKLADSTHFQTAADKRGIKILKNSPRGSRAGSQMGNSNQTASTPGF